MKESAVVPQQSELIKAVKAESNDGQSGGTLPSKNAKATYFNLVLHNRPFRLYFCGYISALLGEWLTYIASISLIEKILSDDSAITPSRTYVSILVVVRLLPSVFLSPFAGALADSRDKRQSMMALDVIGAVIPWMYLVALQKQSLALIYGVTLLKYSVGALYEPSMLSILPLLVDDEHFLQKAVTLTEGLWSVMAGVGSAIGGLVVAYCGFKTCFGELPTRKLDSWLMSFLIRDKRSNSHLHFLFRLFYYYYYSLVKFWTS